MDREMADLISPRNGSTQHELTTRAAQHMIDLVDRAVHVRAAQPWSAVFLSITGGLHAWASIRFRI
jgi:hypothetical protein